MTPLEIIMLLHGFLATLALMAAALMAGVLLFAKDLSESDVRMLKWFSLGTVFIVFLLDLTGTYGYIPYRLPAPSAKATIVATAPWAHEVFFESMEYVSLFGPIIAAAIAYIIWHYGASIVTEPAIKRAVWILLVLGILWGFALIGAGVIPTRIASVR